MQPITEVSYPLTSVSCLSEGDGVGWSETIDLLRTRRTVADLLLRETVTSKSKLRHVRLTFSE